MYPIKVNAKNATMMNTENVSRVVRDQLIEPSLSGDQDRSEPHGCMRHRSQRIKKPNNYYKEFVIIGKQRNKRETEPRNECIEENSELE